MYKVGDWVLLHTDDFLNGQVATVTYVPDDGMALCVTLDGTADYGVEDFEVELLERNK